MSVSPIRRNDPKQVREARKALERFIPKARVRAKSLADAGTGPCPLTPLGAVIERHMRLKNLLGAFIYQTEAGWFADFALRTAPVGVPKVFGTPASTPLVSRAAAEEFAVSVLANLILAERGKVAKESLVLPEDMRVFDMGGLYLSVRSELVEFVGATAAQTDWTVKDGKAALARLIVEDFPCGTSEEIWNGLGTNRQIRYLTEICALLAHDDFQFEYEPARAQPGVTTLH